MYQRCGSSEYIHYQEFVEEAEEYSWNDFKEDLRLIWKNCQCFNQEDSDIFLDSEELAQFTESLIYKAEQRVQRLLSYSSSDEESSQESQILMDNLTLRPLVETESTQIPSQNLKKKEEIKREKRPPVPLQKKQVNRAAPKKKQTSPLKNLAVCELLNTTDRAKEIVKRVAWNEQKERLNRKNRSTSPHNQKSTLQSLEEEIIKMDSRIKALPIEKRREVQQFIKRNFKNAVVMVRGQKVLDYRKISLEDMRRINRKLE